MTGSTIMRTFTGRTSRISKLSSPLPSVSTSNTASTRRLYSGRGLDGDGGNSNVFKTRGTMSSSSNNSSRTAKDVTAGAHQTPRFQKMTDEIVSRNAAINPAYMSWLKSPEIRKEELQKRRQRAREAYSGKTAEQLEQELLAKYKELYFSGPLSLTQLLFHKPIPHHIAVSSFDATIKKRMALSYSQLNQYSNALAHFLKRKGLKKGDAVGAMLHGDHNLVVVLTACLRAGFVYVPLDPMHLKPYQVEERIQDSNCKWIISHVDFHDVAAILPSRSTDLPTEEELLSVEDDSAFNAEVDFFGEEITKDETLNNIHTKNREVPRTKTRVNLLNWTEFGIETPRDVLELAQDDEYFLFEDVERRFNTKSVNELIQEGTTLRPRKEVNEFVSPDDTMCVLYSVDPSGNQTGIKVPYKALGAIHSYMEVGLNIEEEERLWVTLPINSAFGTLYGLIGKLLLGAEAVLPFGSQKGTFLMAAIRALEIDSLVVTDYFLEAVGKDAQAQQSDFLRSCNLKKVVYTGSRMNPEFVEPFEYVWNVSFKNHYATSEDGVLTYNALHPVFESAVKGSTALGYSLALIDRLNELQHDDVDGEENSPLRLIREKATIGEIAVDVEASPLYWLSSFQNKDSDSKFVTVNGRKYALTGDFGRYTGDSDQIEVTGRKEYIVFHRGEKIDVSRVESIICSHPGVEDALLISMRGKKESRLICVAIRKDSGLTVSKQDLEMEAQLIREWLHESTSLKHYEVPNKIIFVKEFPFSNDRIRMRNLLREGFSKGAFESDSTLNPDSNESV